MKFNCEQCGKELEIPDCNKPEDDSAELYCMPCFEVGATKGDIKIKITITGKGKEVTKDILIDDDTEMESVLRAIRKIVKLCLMENYV